MAIRPQAGQQPATEEDLRSIYRTPGGRVKEMALKTLSPGDVARYRDMFGEQDLQAGDALPQDQPSPPPGDLPQDQPTPGPGLDVDELGGVRPQPVTWELLGEHARATQDWFAEAREKFNQRIREMSEIAPEERTGVPDLTPGVPIGGITRLFAGDPDRQPGEAGGLIETVKAAIDPREPRNWFQHLFAGEEQPWDQLTGKSPVIVDPFPRSRMRTVVPDGTVERPYEEIAISDARQAGAENPQIGAQIRSTAPIVWQDWNQETLAALARGGPHPFELFAGLERYLPTPDPSARGGPHPFELFAGLERYLPTQDRESPGGFGMEIAAPMLGNIIEQTRAMYGEGRNLIDDSIAAGLVGTGLVNQEDSPHLFPGAPLGDQAGAYPSVSSLPTPLPIRPFIEQTFESPWPVSGVMGYSPGDREGPRPESGPADLVRGFLNVAGSLTGPIGLVLKEAMEDPDPWVGAGRFIGEAGLMFPQQAGVGRILKPPKVGTPPGGTWGVVSQLFGARRFARRMARKEARKFKDNQIEKTLENIGGYQGEAAELGTLFEADRRLGVQAMEDAARADYALADDLTKIEGVSQKVIDRREIKSFHAERAGTLSDQINRGVIGSSENARVEAHLELAGDAISVDARREIRRVIGSSKKTRVLAGGDDFVTIMEAQDLRSQIGGKIKSREAGTGMVRRSEIDLAREQKLWTDALDVDIPKHPDATKFLRAANTGWEVLKRFDRDLLVGLAKAAPEKISEMLYQLSESDIKLVQKTVGDKAFSGVVQRWLRDIIDKADVSYSALRRAARRIDPRIDVGETQVSPRSIEEAFNRAGDAKLTLMLGEDSVVEFQHMLDGLKEITPVQAGQLAASRLVNAALFVGPVASMILGRAPIMASLAMVGAFGSVSYGTARILHSARGLRRLRGVYDAVKNGRYIEADTIASRLVEDFFEEDDEVETQYARSAEHTLPDGTPLPPGVPPPYVPRREPPFVPPEVGIGIPRNAPARKQSARRRIDILPPSQ